MRKRIYEIIEVAEENDRISRVYDVIMMLTIIISLFPMTVKNQQGAMLVIDHATVVIFVIDYFLRFITADYKYKKHNIISFVRYPFGIMAIIDIFSILPSVLLINKGFKLLKLFRLFRTFRVFRVFKAFRYSKSVRIILSVLKETKESLLAVCSFATAYVLISALIIFNVEPESFETFFDAIYWATVSLTTVGYGDIYPVTQIGRVVTMISSVFGIAVVALPAGIITAGYMEAISKDKE